MRWYLVNKLKGDDLIWSEHYKVGIKQIRHLKKKSTIGGKFNLMMLATKNKYVVMC
jgi:hypothetical protein